ncbi:MAG TPA: hypothetical protein VIK55_20540 [Paludibacter sp.]
MNLFESDEMQELNFPSLFNGEIANRLDTYCRYISKGVTVGEYRVNDGFKHKDVKNVADENKIKFELYMLFYKYEDLEEYRFNFHEKQLGSYGRDKSGEKEYLIYHKTNFVICDFDHDTN